MIGKLFCASICSSSTGGGVIWQRNQWQVCLAGKDGNQRATKVPGHLAAPPLQHPFDVVAQLFDAHGVPIGLAAEGGGVFR